MAHFFDVCQVCLILCMCSMQHRITIIKSPFLSFFSFVPVTLRILNVPARNGPKHIYTLYITRIFARTRKRKHTHNFIDINLIPGMFNFRDLVDIHVLRCARYIKTCIKHGLDAQFTFHNFPLLFSLKLFTVYRLAAFTVY